MGALSHVAPCRARCSIGTDVLARWHSTNPSGGGTRSEPSGGADASSPTHETTARELHRAVLSDVQPQDAGRGVGGSLRKRQRRDLARVFDGETRGWDLDQADECATAAAAAQFRLTKGAVNCRPASRLLKFTA